MRTFLVLVRKELKELVTLQMLAPFFAVILIFVALGGVLRSSGTGATGASVIVIDNDATSSSAIVVSSLEKAGLKVTLSQAENVDALIAEGATEGTGLFITVPEGFAASLEAGKPGTLGLRTVMTNFSLFGTQGEAEARAALAIASQALGATIAAEKAPDVPLSLLQQPIAIDESVTIGKNTAHTSVATVAAFIGQQTLLIPVVLFVVIFFAAQLIATTIATEKENKTLETLLSYPVSRTALVTSKMVAAGLVSLVAAGAYLVGMRQYLNGLQSSAGGDSQAVGEATREVMSQLGLVLGVSDYLTLGLSLFAGILLALSIAIILGAFAESVRAVGALITPLMVLLMVPYLLTMFVDLSAASPVLRWVVLAIPFTHSFTTAQNLFLGNDGTVWLGIGYQLVWFAVFALIAARIFSSDRILTMKLNLRRRR